MHAVRNPMATRSQLLATDVHVMGANDNRHRFEIVRRFRGGQSHYVRSVALDKMNREVVVTLCGQLIQDRTTKTTEGEPSCALCCQRAIDWR